ncbi:MAG: DNA-3-methyladenine glycosylase 2 family protein [Eubacteriaceae bacterium]
MQVFEYSDAEMDYLKSKDETLGNAILKIGHIKRAVTPDLFTALISSIVSQQISSKAYHTVWGRITDSIEQITPQRIADMHAEEIQKFGISMRKAEYIKNAAISVLNGEIDISSLYELSDDEICAQLSKFKGIGVWTAEMLMIFSLQRKNILSYDDLAIIRGMKMLYGYDNVSKEKFREHKIIYSPYASVASLYLWAIAGGADYK